MTYKRRERINAKGFVSLSRLDALNEAKEYLANTYDLTNTLIISNADSGAGYTKKDFDEIVGRCGKHEHFLDVFHLNKKIKDRLCFAPELQGKYWSKAGVESMLRILTCIKNNDLEQWLNSDFETGDLINLDRRKLQAAARDSLKRRHETHIGIQHGALTTEVVGGSYLSKFNRMLNHINY